VKVFSVVGGCAGKTDVVRRLVAAFAGRGVRVSTVKHVPETIDLEKPGSGTWKHREAGVQEVILASTSRMALLREMPTDEDEPDVEALLARLAPVDIVLLAVGFEQYGADPIDDAENTERCSDDAAGDAEPVARGAALAYGADAEPDAEA
jgi:molybdopterin-guanine dinucleotide biosynthesis protein MobB